ncbi:MAG: YihY family inner membrane protein [Deltaproteobacteria bacterium]|nr:YihY family inner membrane protein [Deltaproteobacteria bacterium]
MEINVNFLQVRFWKSVYQHFMEVNALTRASALAYQTLFSLVPLMVASFALSTALPAFAESTNQLESYLFKYLVAGSQEQVHTYIQLFAKQAKGLSIASLLFVIVTAVMMISTMEGTLNTIWDVTKRRKGLNAFLSYWAVITLLPILGGAALSLSAYVTTLPYLSETIESAGKFLPLLDFLAVALIWVAFTTLYVFLPNCHVGFKHAAQGALVATVLFEIAKRSFGYYATHMSVYTFIYGALAAIPVFLIWLYLSWTITLFGACVSSTLTRE